MSTYYSQSSPSTHSWQPRKIRRIARGVKDAKKTDFFSMLNALLGRQLLQCKDSDIRKSTYPEKIRQSKKLLDLMLHTAEEFCADDSSQRSLDMRRHIRECFLDDKDRKKNRPRSLSTALNIVLQEFRSVQLGDLPNPSEQTDGDELIFISNEDMSVESDRLQEHMSKSKRNPDIVATFTSTLQRLHDNRKQFGYDDWVHLNNDHGMSGSPSQDLKWIDIHQTWELDTSTSVALGVPHCIVQNVEQSYSSEKSADPSLSRRRNGLKRPSDEEESHVQRKKARVCSQSETERQPSQIVDSQGNLLPELRCAYYATERLSAGWHISHSTAVLLEDTKLSLRWFDAGGSIESEKIDILEQMPMIVLLLMVLQRFDRRMWGLSLGNPTEVKVGSECYTLDSEINGAFEIAGRRTFGATAVPLSSTDHDAKPRASRPPLFFKSSYTKCVDRKEPETIGLIHKRAETLLPEKYRKMVTDHVPTIIASEECESESTAVVRLLIKLAGGFSQLSEEDILRDSRVRVWMVTRKLQVLQSLPPSSFWRIFWELIRCHYLLWRIGIAHNDISPNNLMYFESDSDMVGVLNDYDLASVMEPGARTPEMDGYERVGTKPFMALDLLRNQEDLVKRRYRHDLESFAWRFLWEMLKETPRWAAKTNEDEFERKMSYVAEIGSQIIHVKKEWRPYFKFIFTWFRGCLCFSNSIVNRMATIYLEGPGFKTKEEKLAFRSELEEKTTDREHLKPVIEAARTVVCDADIETIRDTTWLDVELISDHQCRLAKSSLVKLEFDLTQSPDIPL